MPRRTLSLLLALLISSLFLCTAQVGGQGSGSSRKQQFNAALDAADMYMQQGLLDLALGAFEAAHALNPTDVYTIQGAATALSYMGRLVEAAQYFELAARTNGMPQFFLNAGITYERAGVWEAAIAAYQRCLSASEQQYKPCHVKLAGTFNHIGDFRQAQKHLQLALLLDPTDFQAYSHLGDMFNNLKQFSLAIDTYTKSLPHATTPQQLAAALTSAADSHSNLKQYHAAQALYSRALAASSAAGAAPAAAAPELLIGKLFNELQLGVWGGYEATVAAVLRGAAQQTMGQSQSQSQSTQTQSTQTQSTQSQSQSQGQGQGDGRPSVLSPYRGLFLPLGPALALSVAQSWAQGYLRGEEQAQQPLAPPPLTPLPATAGGGGAGDAAKRRSGPLRVSYLSRRFEDYPGTQMMLRLFVRHNRSRIAVLAHAHGADDGSDYRAFIRDQADAFADLSAMSDAQAAQHIRAQGVDVLVSYDGLHDFNSVKVLIKRPAVVQMTWLGFAATTGFRPGQGIDYVLADCVLAAPDGAGRHFSEKLVFLPGGYQPQDEWQGGADLSADADAAAAPFSSAAFASSEVWFGADSRWETRRQVLRQFRVPPPQPSPLQQSDSEDREEEEDSEDREDSEEEEGEAVVRAFWFVCFNRVEKITAGVFADWMAILARTASRQTSYTSASASASSPAGAGGRDRDRDRGRGSVLLLFSQSPEIDAQLQRNADALGISGQLRLVFLARMPKSAYLRALSVADLFLDTPHYGAHTTASDALFGSLPVLTLPRDSMASRVASSLNSAIALPLLTASSAKDYVDLAVRLCLAPEAVLVQLRRRIQQSLGKEIFNSGRFAGQLERAYQAVYELYPSYKHVYHIEQLQ